MKYKYQITRRNPRRLRQFRPVWLCWKCAGRGKASESRWSYDAGHGQAAVMASGRGGATKQPRGLVAGYYMATKMEKLRGVALERLWRRAGQRQASQRRAALKAPGSRSE